VAEWKPLIELSINPIEAESGIPGTSLAVRMAVEIRATDC
jgi:hypothetical protein